MATTGSLREIPLAALIETGLSLPGRGPALAPPGTWRASSTSPTASSSTRCAGS
jgi:hypothetical protein